MRPRVLRLTIVGVIAVTVLSVGAVSAGGGLDGKFLTDRP